MRDTQPKLRDMSKQARTWYEVKNAGKDTVEIFIYDDIGAGWYTDGVTAKGFIEELNTITASNIDLHLNSPGGSVFDGVAIHNALVRHPAQVTTYIDGLAASIASVIALAGERVVMASNALFMIHNPWGGVQGTASEMRQMADVLDKIRDTLANTYMERTGMAYDEVVALLDAETWYSAQEALNAGFVDVISNEIQAAASFDLTRFNFKHVPQAFATEADPEPVVEAHTDSEADGASDSVTTSDGASEEPINPETAPEAKAETFVAGVGFITF